jgi:hypothetical protein
MCVTNQPHKQWTSYDLYIGVRFVQNELAGRMRHVTHVCQSVSQLELGAVCDGLLTAPPECRALCLQLAARCAATLNCLQCIASSDSITYFDCRPWLNVNTWAVCPVTDCWMLTEVFCVGIAPTETTQDLVPEGLLNHCEGLRSTFPTIRTKCDAHSLFLSLIRRENRHKSRIRLQINACESWPRPPSYVQHGTLTH